MIELADLLAIGVMRSDHQEYLLASVRILRERGAAWVYLIFSQPNTVSTNNIEVITDGQPELALKLNSYKCVCATVTS